MDTHSDHGARRPSEWWVALIALALGLAVGSLVWAVVIQRAATAPIGEGDVFVGDSSLAERLLIAAPDPDIGVRTARNELGIEAVSLLDRDATVVASTSPNKVGLVVSSPLLAGAVEAGRFSALAAAVADPVVLDGVVEWPAGSVLYQVTSPLADGSGSLLLYYDVAGLLGRRVQPGELQPETLQLAGLGLLFAFAGALAIYGRGRTARRYEAIELESSLLRRHSAELEAANRELDRARKDAEAALGLAEEKIRIRSEFVLMINHELRTPLTSVVTGAELIRGSELDEDERRSLLDSMVHDGARLLEIIDQMLAVARIENRGLSRELNEITIHQLTEAITATRMSVEPGTDEQARLTTDAAALNLVIGSLLDNARTHGAKHATVTVSDEPLIAPSMEVGTRPGAAVFVTVSDDGPGIDPEFLPRVFEKFEKSSFSSGTGLGLYLTRMIVEALEGSVAVETSSTGTSFQLALPAAPAMSGARVGV